LLGGPVARAAQSGAANATQGNTANRPAAATTRLPSAAGQSDVAEFLPDGTLDPSSEASVRLVDQSNAAIDVTQNKDGSAYEIEKEIP
jgi:hypothetical protein